MTQDKGGEMMFQRLRARTGLFAPRPAARAGQALYAPVMAQARLPVFYLAGRVADTPTGRFELAVLHLALIERRLRGGDAFTAEAGQALFDAFLSGLDDGLRELGVGDLTVPKTMRRLAEAVYGRFKGLDAALAATDPTALPELLGRTVYAGADPRPVAALAAYVRAADAALTALSLEAVFGESLPWPTPEFEGEAA